MSHYTMIALRTMAPSFRAPCLTAATPRRPLMAVHVLIAIALCIISAPVYATSEHPTSELAEAASERTLPVLEPLLQAKKLRLGSPVFIRIFKSSYELELWMMSSKGYFEHFKTYIICHFSGGLGPKLKEGDRQSPEGFYLVDKDQLNPWSSQHLAFNIGYPNEYDRHHRRTGSAIMVHGKCVSTGCFAMTNYNIEQIYTLVDAAIKGGQQAFWVHVFPFRLTRKNLAAHSHSRWHPFWTQLKKGFDLFEYYRTPPHIGVENGAYTFNAPPPVANTNDSSATTLSLSPPTHHNIWPRQSAQ
jgi:murein L,D-transpeptidase YafK